MKHQSDHPQTERFVRLLSLAVAGFGLFAWFRIVLDFIDALNHPKSLSRLAPSLFGEALVFLIGVWWLRAAYLGWYHRSARAIRWLCASAATIACLSVPLLILPDAQTDPRPQTQWTNFIDLGAIPLAVGLYLFGSRSLIYLLGLVDERSPAEQIHAARRGMQLIASLLLTEGMNLAMEILPRKHNRPLPTEPWGLLPLLAAVCIAALIYKLGMRLLTPRPPAILPPALTS